MHEEHDRRAGAAVLRRQVTPRRSVIAHREHVVRRLLARGLSSRLLQRLLPEWGALIERTAAEHDRRG